MDKTVKTPSLKMVGAVEGKLYTVGRSRLRSYSILWMSLIYLWMDGQKFTLVHGREPSLGLSTSLKCIAKSMTNHLSQPWSTQMRRPGRIHVLHSGFTGYLQMFKVKKSNLNRRNTINCLHHPGLLLSLGTGGSAAEVRDYSTADGMKMLLGSGPSTVGHEVLAYEGPSPPKG